MPLCIQQAHIAQADAGNERCQRRGAVKVQVIITCDSKIKAYVSCIVPVLTCRLPHHVTCRDVAQYVADTFIADGQTVGLGTGLPINALIEEISQRLGSGQLKVRLFSCAACWKFLRHLAAILTLFITAMAGN